MFLRAPITIGITVTFIFHNFQFFSKVHILILLFVFFQFYTRVSKINNSASSLFSLLSWYLIVWPRLGDPFVSQNPWGFFESHSPGQILGLLVCSNFTFLHNSMWITFPTHSCLILYSFCTNSLVTWLIVSSLSLHNLHLIFCFYYFYLFNYYVIANINKFNIENYYFVQFHSLVLSQWQFNKKKRRLQKSRCYSV